MCGCSQMAKNCKMTGMIECYDSCSKVYQKNRNLLNLNTLNRDRSKATNKMNRNEEFISVLDTKLAV